MRAHSTVQQLLSTRRRYRASHQTAAPLLQLEVRLLNVQGLNPYRSDNRGKMSHLITEARDNSWDIAILADIHGVREGDELSMMAIEEFIMIITGKCAMLLGPRIARKWVKEGALRSTTKSGRMLTISLQTRSEGRRMQHLHFMAV